MNALGTRRLIRITLVLTGVALLGLFIMTEISVRTRREPPLPVYGPIADFSLTNQDGKTVSLADLRGEIWIADIIFTRCAGSCPHMTRQMEALQQALVGERNVRLVSLTADPEYDTSPILKRYAERFGADPNRWLFLTGPKRQLANLAVQSLKLSAVPKTAAQRTSPEDLFIHSTILVVVGKHAQLRGVFQTTGDGIDPKQVQPQILDAVSRLERES